MKKRSHKRRKQPAAPPIPFRGDFGPQTPLQQAGTCIEAVPEDKNNTGRKRRVSQIEFLHRQAKHKINLRQYGAARAIQRVRSKVEALSSGDALKEQVDNSPRPDAAIAAHVDAMSDEVRLLGGLEPRIRGILEWVCWHNESHKDFTGSIAPWADLIVGLDSVANRMDRYHISPPE